jgi:hypothetical protein
MENINISFIEGSFYELNSFGKIRALICIFLKNRLNISYSESCLEKIYNSSRKQKISVNSTNNSIMFLFATFLLA